MAKTKKETIANLAKLLLLAFVVSVVLTIIGQGAYAVLAGAATLAVGAFSGYLGNLGVKKDSHRWGAGIFALILVVGALSAPNPVSQAWVQYSNQISGMVTGGGGALGSIAQPTPTTGSGQRIVATTATLTITAETLTNRTLTSINPSGYRKSGDSYITLSFSSGSASVSSLDPSSVIDKLSTGTDGTYYWGQVENLALNGQLSPSYNFKLVPVATADTLSLYDNTITDIGNQSSTETDRPNQVTVGAGGALSFVIRPEVTSTATGLRAPILAFEYNVSTWDTVDMGNLPVVDCPTRLVTTTSERTLSKCYDMGLSWLFDAGSKAGVAGANYGYKDFNGKATAVSGINPGNITGHCIRAYVIDRDEYFKSKPGTLFFVDPERGTLNLGKTSQTTRSMCVL